MTDLFSPTSDWRPPTILPDLSSTKILGVDLETFDPGLKKHGPGSIRKDGHVAGISIAGDNGKGYYLPIAHQDGGNLPKPLVINYLTELLSSDTPKVFANALYDLEWLHSLGIKVNGKCYDVQLLEHLIDENQKDYSLKALGLKYVGEGKDEALLVDAVRSILGKKDVKGNLWRLHSSYVGPYAEQDAILPVKILTKQWKEIEKQDLKKIVNLETDLTPSLLNMRVKGVNVDLDNAEQVSKRLERQEHEAQDLLNKKSGIDCNVWANESLGRAYDNCSIPYGRTPTGKPSFTQNFLDFAEDELSSLVLKVRKLNKLRNSFIHGMILEKHVDGRVHCQFNARGAVTGRFSSSNPNLQQVPARDEELSKLIRGLFLPEKDERWYCIDYAQQEPRLLVHFASRLKLPESITALSAYKNDETTDFHTMVASMAGIKRKQAKTINLGLFYGMGKKKLANQLGLETDEAEKLFRKYHTRVPFVRGLYDRMLNYASKNGYVKTLLGRKRHFDLWENANDFGSMGHPLKKAKEVYKGKPIRRAYTHKALNSLIQGSAADVTKAAMLKIYKAGLLTPLVTVHDELDFSVPQTSEGDKMLKEIVHEMRNCVDLDLPLQVDVESGNNWGNIE
jgi:DNA polymerase I-like protein with 3'-5' exonuclease and polymerase domains|tara:strand:+ start:8565 stop:10427 length:1863 start_codon:yes stop_codon:yes gene_type:complete